MNECLKNVIGNIIDPKIPHLEIKMVETDNGINVKFANGLMIEIIETSYSNIPCSTAWGGIYASNQKLSFPNYSEPFVDTPFVIVSPKSKTGNHWCYRTEEEATNTNAGKYTLARGNSANVSGNVTLFAIGRWK